MKEEIEKLGQVIDSLRTKGSDPELAPYLVEWLKDPACDPTPVHKLLIIRGIIFSLVDQRAQLIELLEDEAYSEESLSE